MKNLNWKPIEGNPDQIQAQVSAKLLSISDEPREFNNEKRTKYYLGTCEFDVVNDDGVVETKRTTCMIYANNHKYGMEVGKSYLTNLRLSRDKKIYVNMSHLQGAGVLSLDDLGIDDASIDSLFGAPVESTQESQSLN